MGKSRLLKTTYASLTFQIVTIICGFIVPRLILQSYGSEVNGLVNSITQFLAVISFLELGVGAVMQSALYKPLALKEDLEVSKIVTSATKFFKKLAQILLGYVVVLVVIYPYISNNDFDFVFTAVLIIAIGFSSFAQYYFGMVDGLLLIADQRGYIQYNIQTITLILNTLVCGSLMHLGFSIQVVKIVTSTIYLFRPILLRFYVNKNYKIDRKASYDEEPIRQKWNGVAQHIASVVLDSTDTVVLTLLSTLSNISIYSVYSLVTVGIKRLFYAVDNGIRARIGELWAKKEIEKLNSFFCQIEWGFHTCITFIYGCVGILIVPFVQVYTYGIEDVNYVQPWFAALLTVSYAINCLRLPYNGMILAAGHYKETQYSYIIAAVLNVIVSVASVKCWGLIGVAIGTLSAMIYQTCWIVNYTSNNLLKWPLKYFVKHIIVDILNLFLLIVFTHTFRLESFTYLSWFILAVKVVSISGVITIVLNCVFYKQNVVNIVKTLRSKILKHVH